MLLFAAGCGSTWELDALYGDLSVALPAQVIEGEVADGGFGMAVTRAGATVAMGAPLAAQVRTRRGVDGQATTGSFYGAALAALDDETILVGAPGTGYVATLTTGERVAEGEGLGGAITARDGRWVASQRSGVRWDDGKVEFLDARPDSLALFADGTLALGFARGDTAVRIGSRTLPRTSPGSEEGFAVLVGDVLGEGHEEIAVGAPGLGRVDVYDRDGVPLARIEGEGGRFGAALALFSPGVLYVGAPMAHDAAGALWRHDASGTTEVLAGETPDEELGSALWAGRGNVLVGAPGGAGARGRVVVLVP